MIHQRAAARADLVNHFVYLANEASLETADRFLVNARGSFEDLEKHPGMGAPVALDVPALAGLRKWAVHDFENHLIFYLPRPDGVSIVRVLHRSQDWWRTLAL
ncbi:MAG: type II toxin-antitoxin system RelE/ParE family toxin [Burkholderiaceae bacterium]